MPRRESGGLNLLRFRMPGFESGRLPQNMTSDLLTLVKPKGRELRELHGVFTETLSEISPAHSGPCPKFTDGKGSHQGSITFSFASYLRPSKQTSTSYFETRFSASGMVEWHYGLKI